MKLESGNRRRENDRAFRQRTFDFGIRCLHVVEALPKTVAAQTIGKQLLRAGTSGGANYRAAVRSRSRADFIAKMGIVEEECDEALHWLDVLSELRLVQRSRIEALYNEGNEILAVTVTSSKTARANAKQ